MGHPQGTKISLALDLLSKTACLKMMPLKVGRCGFLYKPILTMLPIPLASRWCHVITSHRESVNGISPLGWVS